MECESVGARHASSRARATLGRWATHASPLRTVSAFWAGLRAFLYGATGYEFEREAAHVRSSLENLFIFMIAGDTLGVPVLPPYYSLRLLPYLHEILPAWQRRVLRERHPLDSEEFDLHGL